MCWGQQGTTQPIEVDCQGRTGKRIKSFKRATERRHEAFKYFFSERNFINILDFRIGMFVYVAPGDVDGVRLGEKGTLKGNYSEI